MQRLVSSLRWLTGMAVVGALLAPVLAARQSSAQNAPVGNGVPSSVSQLKQIGLALLMYAQDYDEMLPPMQNAATVKRALSPYVRGNEAVFADPLTHEPYQPNPGLSGRRRSLVVTSGRDSQGKPTRPRRHPSEIPAPAAQVVAFYEASPAPDGTRAVLFLDGHVQVIPEAEWPRLKRASRIR
jgi:prepilin-type processing-associated H-X9-DG protein